MANHEQVTLLRSGVTEWNKWKDENAEIIPDLARQISVRQTSARRSLATLTFAGQYLLGQTSPLQTSKAQISAGL